MIPKNAISVVYGWNNPITGEKEPYKIIISRYYVDIDVEFPTPPSEEATLEELEAYEEKLRKFEEQFGRFRRENISGKCRFYAQNLEEFKELVLKLEGSYEYTTNEIKLTKAEKLIVEECEQTTPFPKVDDVRKRLGCV